MKYIIVSENTTFSSMFEVLFNDICTKENGIFLHNYLTKEDTVRKFIFKILYSERINKYLRSNFEIFLKPNFDLIRAIKKENGQDTCVIFNNTSINKYYNTRGAS